MPNSRFHIRVYYRTFVVSVLFMAKRWSFQNDRSVFFCPADYAAVNAPAEIQNQIARIPLAIRVAICF